MAIRHTLAYQKTAAPTLATGDVSRVISRPRLPLGPLSRVYVEKIRGAWERGYYIVHVDARHFIVVNCTTMCSMNLLQAPNQHHFEVLIGVDWVTCIIEDSP